MEIPMAWGLEPEFKVIGGGGDSHFAFSFCEIDMESGIGPRASRDTANIVPFGCTTNWAALAPLSAVSAAWGSIRRAYTDCL